MTSRDKTPDPFLLWVGDTLDTATLLAAYASPLAVLAGVAWWLLR